ncbi:MAG: hypothetical protein QXG39_10055 [Candidatus Aenigmatarchaeota archaeon]
MEEKVIIKGKKSKLLIQNPDIRIKLMNYETITLTKSLEDNKELADAIEKYLEEQGYKRILLSKGMNDYGVVFVYDNNTIFILLIDDELYIVDFDYVFEDPVIAMWFSKMIINFFEKVSVQDD